MPTSSISLSVTTAGRGFVDITKQVDQVVRAAGVDVGVCTVFIHHTSASLVIQENADPDVRRDLETFFSRLVPDGDRAFVHRDEGDDDMPAHVRAALTQTSVGLPVRDGRLDLGRWQALYVYEHRRAPRARRVSVIVIG